MTNSVVIDKPIIDDGLPPDPEALIEEARRRTRRRRAAYAAALGLLILGVLTGVVGTRGGSKKLPTMTPRSPLTVDARAFHAHGVLAFVSKGSLYVLDGASGRLAHLADARHTASDPTLSPDGRWLAYLEDGRDGAHQLWIARANGTGAHRVASLGNTQILGWRPKKEVLAVVSLPPPDWTCRSKSTTKSVVLVTPPGALRTVYSLADSCANPRGFYGAVWSPDGNSLAVATTNFKRSGGSRVFAIDLATGARRTWFAIRTTHHFPGACRSSCISDEVVADLAGWWRKRGIGFWVFSSGMSANEDGSPLEVVSAPGAKPTRLGTALSDGTDTAVAASATGALAVVHATWRDIGSGGTEVRTCAPGATWCAPVPDASIWTRPTSFSCHPRRYTYCYAPKKPGAPDSGVTLDPSWSPNGSLLAYVDGPSVPQDATPTGQWLDQHHLFLYDSATGTTRKLPGTEGASAPQWSADGRSILYVSRDSLWLVDLQSGRSARIAGPLFGGASFAAAYNANNFYHQVPFTQQFGWSS